MPQNVIFGMPQWHPDNQARYAGRLVAGLVSAGHDAHILLTGSEQAGRPGTASPLLPSRDLPWETLPAGPRDTWGQRWEALERYLEERAPCHFLTFPGSTANRIAPRLSDRIGVVCLLPPDETPDDHELDGLDRQQIRDWYKGYNWTGEAVYNPFDLLLLFDKRQFRPYWFETGTPTAGQRADRQPGRPSDLPVRIPPGTDLGRRATPRVRASPGKCLRRGFVREPARGRPSRQGVRFRLSEHDGPLASPPCAKPSPAPPRCCASRATRRSPGDRRDNARGDQRR